MPNRPHSLIIITPGFSRLLAFYLLLLHLSALLVFLPFHLSLASNLIFSTAVCISLLYFWRMDLLHQGPRSICSAKWSEEEGWIIRDSTGREERATLDKSSFLSQYLVILIFNVVNSSSRKLLLPGDAIDHDKLRRLKVLLRMRDHFGM